jgi:maltose-binding protein MalE
MKNLFIKVLFIYFIVISVNCRSARGQVDKEYFQNKPPIIACTFYPEILQGMRAVTKDFEANTGIKVHIQSVPYELFEMWLQSRFLAGRAPEVMIMEKKQMFWRYGQNE